MGTCHVEPQFMHVFLRLLASAGQVVTRQELFDECWGGVAVGDDSLNRAVAGARQLAASVGSSAFTIETVPRTGYILALGPAVDILPVQKSGPCGDINLQAAVEDAYDCWRSGLPRPDHDAIRALGSALEANDGDARAWGISALLLRKAAEYADAHECAPFVRNCERSARRALALCDDQADALVALAGIVPIFGNWSVARRQLTAVRASDPDHIPAAHDMAVLEMATGRPSAAAPIILQLIGRDPLGATFYYKRMYHLWTLGEIRELDVLAARAFQLWPRHPAIWSARLWTLLFTDRAAQGLQLLEDEGCPPPLPPQMVGLLRNLFAVVADIQGGVRVSRSARDQAVTAATVAATRGPAQAVASLLLLLALDAIDEAYEVACGYFLGRGSAAAPLRWNSSDPSITDQHRRITQILFIPAAERMREDPRFPQLCRDIGLSAYWDEFGVEPDFVVG